MKKLPPFPEAKPELLHEWDYEQNAGIDPYSISAGSSRKFWWKCIKDPTHKWDASVNNRVRLGHRCPICAGKKFKAGESLVTLYPHLLKDWHPTKNSDLDPSKLSPWSRERVVWLCHDCAHEWTTSLFIRTKQDKGCPNCTGRIASEKNSLATCFPDIAAEWHPTRNGNLTPRDVTSKSHQRVWWKCKTCLYEWKTSVHMRTILKSGCEPCSHDIGVLKSKKIRIEKQESELPNYDYETDDRLIANAQESRQMLSTQIKIEADLKTIESLLNPRLLSRINYQPYYQRHYVWDKNKATYFIESVLIGTEVPPLIFYESSGGFEVIDGRQRFETLLRYQGNQFPLSPKGLAVRKDIAHKRFDDLSPEDKNFFFDAKLRQIRFSVVNPESVDEHAQDMLKKEIFRRYNSGITPLRGVDIEKAVYITDEPTQYLKRKFQKNECLYGHFVNLFLGISDIHAPDVMEKVLQEVRFLLVCANMPILSTRKKETLQQFYERFSETDTDVQSLYRDFTKRVILTKQLGTFFAENNIKPTKFWNEVVYWALAIMELEGHTADLLIDEKKEALLDLYRLNERVYAPAEPQFFYRQFLNRYSTMASFLENSYGISSIPYLRKQRTNTKENDEVSGDDSDHFTRIEKQDPTSLSVEDLCRDILRSRFLLRPSYQRNEVINPTKSSGIIESMLLGIKLPPLYAFRRTDGVCEIIDGQQRILSIIGYLGSPFLNEKGEQVYSNKNNFPLKKLRILDLTGKTFKDLDPSLQNRIWDYNLSIITIDEKFNKGFSPVDLFIRLNSRPYPIKDNTFEMWNSYADKDIIDSIKQVTSKHSSWFCITRDTKRMRNEELITILTYLSYTQLTKSSAQAPIDNVVDVFRTPLGIGVRIKQKAAVTLMMDMATISSDMKEKEEISEAVKKTEAFIRKVRTILINKDTEDDSFLDKQLTSLFNVAGRHWYVRRNHDFYALWYLLYDITPEVAIRRRDEIRNDLNDLLRSMKKESKEAETEIAPFMSAVSAFKAKYAVAERKIRLTREQKNELIKKQNNICPLCETSIFIMDDIEGDHAIPLGIQGPDEHGNFQIVHTNCNRKKGVTKKEEF
ncbi:MAG: DUF262 domain-containing protein [Nitrospiraceae bacterium]|nr:MAG: DUF262 domain-containing protein [Nitrospiraceae bacterium]